MMASVQSSSRTGFLSRLQQRRHSDPKPYKAKLIEASRFDSYTLNGEDSSLHWDMMTHRTHRHLFILQATSWLLVLAIGVVCSAIAVALAKLASTIHESMAEQTQRAMWPCESSTTGAVCEARLGASFAAFVGMRLTMVLGAAVLVCWQPDAAISGLPKIKSNLNGTKIPGYLGLRVLVAKAIGITLVVSSGLPLGKEGPMVHIGAMVASLLSSMKVAWMGSLFELRLPAAQRGWVGMGAAAGVAAAFHAPLGGILYSFEEVCSHWSSSMTWRSFVCAVVVACSSQFFLDLVPGLGHGSFVLGLPDDSRLSFSGTDMGWFAALGLLGGALGAAYNAGVQAFNHRRQAFYKRRRRWRASKAAEALALALMCFTLFFLLPFGFSCRPCPAGSKCDPSYDGSSSSSSYSSAALSGLVPGEPDTPVGLYNLEYVRFNCPAGEHNEMATLIQSGQEGVLKHLYMRSAADGASEPTLACCATLLLCYFLLAVSLFGVALPAGNFVPGMTIGGLLGRLVAQLAFDADYIEGTQRGTFALIGTAAVLGGMTRMTLTLSVILVELTKDVALLPALMFTLAISRAVGDALNHSFDDMMIHIQGLPYLEEEAPHQLEVLAARDVMSSPVVKLPEKVRVAQLVATLRESPHNGFPVVGSKLETMHYVCGLILRQQIEVILRDRLWGHQSGKKVPLSYEVSFRHCSLPQFQ